MGREAKVKEFRRQNAKLQKAEVKRWLGEAQPLANVAEEEGFKRGLRLGKASGRAQGAFVTAVMALVAVCYLVLSSGCGDDVATYDGGADAGDDASAIDGGIDATPADARKVACSSTVHVVGWCDEKGPGGAACAKCSAFIDRDAVCWLTETRVCVSECWRCGL